MHLFRLSKLTTTAVCVLAMLGANAHAQQVALLDSGAEEGEGYTLTDGFNYFLNSDDTSDVSARDEEGHGTVSARLVGEAFTGEIVPFVVTDGAAMREFEDQTTVARDSALSDILGRADVRVVGITWGTEGVTGSSAPLLPQLSNANKVVAIMAGNEFKSQPNALSTTSFNLDGVIIVGGTDADGVLLPQTNRAGTTANKYVTAIGLPTLDALEGGSSWATARISGIAGAVLQQNPNLTAAEVVDVILQSAEDLGETGIDSEYGRGFIRNAKQVLDNVIGPIVVPIPPPIERGPGSGSSGGGGGAAGLLLGGALAGALLLMKKPKGKLEKTLVLDSYGRTFQLDLGEQIVVDEGDLHLNQFFHSLDQTSVSDGFELPGLRSHVVFAATTNVDHRLDMKRYFSDPTDVAWRDQQASVSMAISSQLSNDVALNAGYQINPDQLFGGASELSSHTQFGASSFISGQSFSSLLTGFGAQANALSFNYQPSTSKKSAIKAGLISIKQTQRFGRESFSSVLESRYKFNDKASVAVQFGQIEEQGSLFGGSAGGIFGVDTATTYAVNLRGVLRASDKFQWIANYGIGRTHVDSSDDSLLGSFSSLSSDWYSLGLVGNNVWRTRDQIGFSFSQPLKVRSGNVSFSLPTHRAFSGDIAFDTERVNLADTNATENRIEGYYRTMLNDKIELGSFLSYRKNPNHVSDDGNELLLMATFRYQH